MKKRMMCIIMACILMGTTVLTGCGGKETPTTDAKASNEKSQEGSGDVTGPVDITVAALRDDPFAPWADTTMIKELEEECKDLVNITWIDIPQSMKEEKLNLAFSSGDYPDVVLGTWILSADKVVDYASQGVLLPLEEYFTEDIMPNWSRLLEERPEIMEGMSLSDGHIYSLISRDEKAIRQFNDTVVINTEWLAKVGKEMPTTTEEFYDVLKAFKEAGDLNGNGKNDEIPFSCVYGTANFGEHMRGLMSMFGWFGIAQNQQGMQMMNDKIIFNPAQPEYKEGIAYFNRLYTEGLMDIESFTQSYAAYDAKTINANPAQVGVFAAWNDVTVNNTLGGSVYQYLPPLTSGNGKAPQWQRRYTPVNFYLGPSITDKAAGKEEQIMKFLDKFYEKERSMKLLYGGDKYVEAAGENIYHQVTDENGNTYAEDVKSSESPGKFSMYYLKDGDYTWDVDSPGDISQKRASDLYEAYLQTIPDFKNDWVTREVATEVSLIFPDLTNYVRESTAKWITKGGVNEEWDNYIKQLNKLQVNEWMTNIVKEEFQDKIQRVE